MKIIDFCTIRSGYSFRGKIDNDPEGSLAVIQMSDLKNNYTVISNSPCKIKDVGFDSHYLQKDDILFISKGSNNVALLYNGTFPMAVASAIFFILRVNNTHIAYPEFVAWYINQKPAQSIINKGRQFGISVPNINKPVLEDIEITLPSLETQKKIVALHQLSEQEKFLEETILKKKKLFIENILLEQTKTI